MGYSDKYGYVATTRQGETPIEEDEPVAIIAAHDPLAIETLQFYEQRCKDIGRSPEHLASVNQQIINFISWRADRNLFPTDEPDLIDPGHLKYGALDQILGIEDRIIHHNGRLYRDNEEITLDQVPDRHRGVAASLIADHDLET